MGKGISEHFSEFTTATQDYVETTIKYQKLDLYKKGIKAGISIGYGVVLLLIGLIALLFLSVAAAIFIGQALDNLGWGYLIMGVIYILIMVVVALTIKPKIQEMLLKSTSKSLWGLASDKRIEEV
ncbi:MAG: phage holin family protein [Nonlabens sp.]